MSIADKWKNKVSRKEEAAIAKKMKEQEQEQGRRTFREIPAGTYTVTVDKLELGETTWGSMQVKMAFKIIEGEYKDQRIFYDGTFDDHFAHGINATAILLADMLEDEDLTSATIAVILSHANDSQEKLDEVSDLLADILEEIDGLCFELEYEVKESNKTNPNTGKAYINKYYTIVGAYEL